MLISVRPVAMVLMVLAATDTASAAQAGCRWDGTAPFCHSESDCTADEIEVEKRSGGVSEYEGQFLPPFGDSCLTGAKALCCKRCPAGLVWRQATSTYDMECVRPEERGKMPAKTTRGPHGEELTTNRPGKDYSNFVAGSYDACRQACESDHNCLAWTAVGPGKPPSPLWNCWLKNDMPAPVPDFCCVSGTVANHAPAGGMGLPQKPAGSGCLIGGVNRTDIADQDCAEAQQTGCIRHLLSDDDYAACLRAQPVVSTGCLIGGVMRNDIADSDCLEAQQTGCIRRLLTQEDYANCLAAQK